MSTEIKAHQSLTGFAVEKVATLLQVNQEDSAVKKYAKLSAATVSNAVLVLAGTIETLIRTVIAVLAKAVQFFIPSSKSESFDKKILNPALFSAEMTGLATAQAASRVVTNFLSTQTKEKVEEKIDVAFSNFFYSPAMDSIINYHVDTLVADTKAGLVAAKTAIVNKAVVAKSAVVNKAAVAKKAISSAVTSAKAAILSKITPAPKKQGLVARIKSALGRVPATIGFKK